MMDFPMGLHYAGSFMLETGKHLGYVLIHGGLKWKIAAIIDYEYE